jgi:tetratricopeptide (TPR) repeat protein
MRRFSSVAATVTVTLLLIGAAGAAATEPPSAESALARGLVLLDQRQYDAAWPLLEAALERPDLQPQFRLTAVRALSTTSLAAAATAPKAQQDAHYARAFRWAQAWEDLDKDAVEAHTTAAESLWKLGDYDGAKAEYDLMYRRWPRERFWAAISMASIDRERGRHADSLADLDRLTADTGARQGMPVHYHRAATLMMLGRDAEAIREIDEGLVAQPGYGWAYARRACADARIRKFDQAIADQRFALEVMRALPAEAASEAYKTEKIQEIQALLDAYVAAKAGGPSPPDGPGNCRTLVIGDSKMRSPSPLLAAVQPSPGPK